MTRMRGMLYPQNQLHKDREPGPMQVPEHSELQEQPDQQHNHNKMHQQLKMLHLLPNHSLMQCRHLIHNSAMLIHRRTSISPHNPM